MTNHAEAPTAALHALQAENAALREAVRARDDFIANAARELRSPMTPMLLTIEGLRASIRRMTGVPPHVTAALDRLDRAAVHYVSRLRFVLDVSRIASGNYKLDLATVDAAAVAQRVVEAMRHEAERTSTPLSLSAPDSAPVVADELALAQVVENLLSNALKHGGGAPVRVEVQQLGDAVRITVADAGPGISPSDQDRIHGPFERAVTRRQQAGHGLGLWVVGQLADAMHAMLDVSSTPGKGSAFTLTLPSA